jgi:H+/Cl- antiporter ClcA
MKMKIFFVPILLSPSFHHCPINFKLSRAKGGMIAMNTRVKLAILWGVMITAALVVINFILHLAGGYQTNVVFQNGFRPEGRGHHGGRGPHPFMNGPHHGGEFSWFGLLLFLIIGLAILVLIVRWVRKKAKNSAMQQFMVTTVVGSHIPIVNQNASMLDQWEKNITKKGE